VLQHQAGSRWIPTSRIGGPHTNRNVSGWTDTWLVNSQAMTSASCMTKVMRAGRRWRTNGESEGFL